MGPLLLIVQSWSPGLAWWHLCSIRAWQNNGQKWEGVVTQAHVGRTNWSHWGWVCSFWVKIWIFPRSPSVAVCNWQRLSVLIPLVLPLCWWGYPPSAWQCWLMCNKFCDHDLFGEPGLSESWLKIWVLKNLLQSCYHLRCGVGLHSSLCVSAHWPFFLHFRPLVCHLASHDFTIIKVLIFFFTVKWILRCFVLF